MTDILTSIDFTKDILVNYVNAKHHTRVPLDHYHNYYEIYFYFGNSMRYFIAEKAYDVQENDIVLIDRYAIHRSMYRTNERRHRLLILFHPRLIERIEDEKLQEKIRAFFENRKVTLVSNHELELFRRKALELLEISRLEETPLRKIRLEYQFFNVLLHLLDLEEKDRIFNHEPWASGKPEQLVEKALVYINENYHNRITLDDIASALYISKHYLSRTFNELTEYSISEYLNAKRLSEAERLLLYTDFNLTRIYQEVGYSSSSYFITLFKKKYNCTPQAFRSRMRKENTL